MSSSMIFKYSRAFLCFIVILLTALFAAPEKAYSQKKATADTVTDAGLQFTPIMTAADSMAAKAKAQKQNSQAKTEEVSTSAAGEQPKSAWGIFIAGFLQGLLAVAMPCIYPLLPLTVSFFTKRSGSRSKGIAHSVLYGVSIIVIYVSLGIIISLIFGPAALNALATNGIFNLFLFLMLVVFGISFLGAFEITLPSSLANKLDENSDKGGLAGIFFMAATLVVVSFSCTGAFIGDLLALSAINGNRIAPAMGMFGFSLALALPFTIFALFPSLLKSLPKSGGWLNAIKVVLGFLELAFSLKFLSNVDLAYHWNWLNRDIFLSLWIALGILTVLYLLGKLKFSHDSDLPFINVPRIMIAIVFFAFVIYMIPGLWGAPLRVISGFLPPPATQEFDLTKSQDVTGGNHQQTTSIQEIKYDTLFSRGKHRGMNEWYDYQQALEESKALKKPVLIDFTGWVCANCRKMEQDVWTNPAVFKRMQNDFILLELYVDEKTDLPINEQYTSTGGRRITSIGAKNSDFETTKFNTNSQPYYVIMDSNGNVLVPPQGANYNAASYLNFLNSGLNAFQSKR
jgi:thiol:disulfide interchange protein DsbD